MKRTSFTLVEIIMVVALIAVLTGIAIGGYSYAMGASRESATRATLKQLEAAFESGKTKHGFYPASTSMPTSGSDHVIKLFGADGEEISDAALATAWGNLPDKYIKDFRRALDLESLRQYIDASGVVCDAWGNPIVYTAPDTDKKKPFTLRSKGPDGDTGSTASREDDITNWD